ncbi:MAG: ATP-binding protein [Eubacteriales bacterium]|nr:ATP-binding protein [Eubacteriales bacterium]
MQPFTLMEAVLYNLLRSIPLIMLGFYPFREKRRFSAKITSLMFEAILLVWVFSSVFNIYYAGTIFFRVIGEIVGIILIAVLYVAALKGHPGKMLFFCFMLINVGYMTTATSKCIEGVLFPDLVRGRYMWSASLCLCLVSPFILYPVFLFIRWEKQHLTRDMQPGYIWDFSWLVPTTFYLIWAHDFYSSGNPLEWVLNPFNILYLGIVNLASFLVYYLILRMVIENNRSLQLREENHALTLQVMQYDDLNKRIAAARQGRHDLRHHIVTMENMLNAGNVSELRQYLSDMTDRYQLDGALTYCSNTTVNGILMYFANEAKEQGIDYKVNIGIPENIPISKTDLSIIFGNLIENAVEACQKQNAGERKIQVRGQTSKNTFTLTIDNTYETAPVRDKRGRFRSMKHSGMGIGTESVKSIVERYKGVIEFETRGDLFCVSVMLYL